MAQTKLSQAERRNLSEEKLIEAALSIAAEEGYAAVTFDAIGKRAGYSRGLATHRFGSKAGLIEAVIDHLQDYRIEIENELNPRPVNGLAGLLGYAEIHLNSLKESPSSPAYFVFLAGAIAEMSDMRKLFARSHDRTRGQLVEHLERGQQDGSVRKLENVDAAALSAGALLLGISMAWLADPDMPVDDLTLEVKRTLRASFAEE